MRATSIMRWALVCLLCLPAILAGESEPLRDPTYLELRSASPDGRRVEVDGFELVRDAFTFRLSGTIDLLGAVEGREIGAVFRGDGELILDPSTEGERRHLARRLREPEL